MKKNKTMYKRFKTVKTNLKIIIKLNKKILI